MTGYFNPAKVCLELFFWCFSVLDQVLQSDKGASGTTVLVTDNIEHGIALIPQGCIWNISLRDSLAVWEQVQSYKGVSGTSKIDGNREVLRDASIPQGCIWNASTPASVTSIELLQSHKGASETRFPTHRPRCCRMLQSHKGVSETMPESPSTPLITPRDN